MPDLPGGMTAPDDDRDDPADLSADVNLEPDDGLGPARPWRLDAYHPEVGHDAAGRPVFNCCQGYTSAEQGRANAALIVRAVNCHDDLLAACEFTLKQLDSPAEGHIDRMFDRSRAEQMLRAAIVKARGQ